jgi:hypothetical protein
MTFKKPKDWGETKYVHPTHGISIVGRTNTASPGATATGTALHSGSREWGRTRRLVARQYLAEEARADAVAIKKAIEAVISDMAFEQQFGPASEGEKARPKRVTVWWAIRPVTRDCQASRCGRWSTRVSGLAAAVRPNLIVASIYDGSAAAWALEFHLGMMRKSFRFVRHHIEHSRFSPLGMLRFRMIPDFFGRGLLAYVNFAVLFLGLKNRVALSLMTFAFQTTHSPVV